MSLSCTVFELLLLISQYTAYVKAAITMTLGV